MSDILIYFSIPDDIPYPVFQSTMKRSAIKLSFLIDEMNNELSERYKIHAGVINITEDVFKINPYDITEDPGKWGLFKLSVASLNMAKADWAWFTKDFRKNSYTNFEYDLAVFGGLKILTEEEFDANHPDFDLKEYKAKIITPAPTELLSKEEESEDAAEQ